MQVLDDACPGKHWAHRDWDLVLEDCDTETADQVLFCFDERFWDRFRHNRRTHELSIRDNNLAQLETIDRRQPEDSSWLQPSPTLVIWFLEELKKAYKEANFINEAKFKLGFDGITFTDKLGEEQLVIRDYATRMHSSTRFTTKFSSPLETVFPKEVLQAQSVHSVSVGRHTAFAQLVPMEDIPRLATYLLAVFPTEAPPRTFHHRLVYVFELQFPDCVVFDWAWTLMVRCRDKRLAKEFWPKDPFMVKIWDLIQTPREEKGAWQGSTFELKEDAAQLVWERLAAARK